MVQLDNLRAILVRPSLFLGGWRTRCPVVRRLGQVIGALMFTSLPSLHDLIENGLSPPARCLLVTLLVARVCMSLRSSCAILSIHFGVVPGISSFFVSRFSGWRERRCTYVDGTHPVAGWSVGHLTVAHIEQHLVTLSI